MKKSFKTQHLSTCTGFTLVELLVVIAIIAILAAVLASAANFALKAALRAKGANLASQLQSGAMGYYTEYSLYPVPTTPPTTTDIMIADSGAAAGASWQTLICVLCGNVHPSDGTAFTAVAAGPANNRGIPFLTLKSADVFTAKDVTANPNGVQDAPKNPMPTSTTADLFFYIAFDSDYNGIMGNGQGTPASALTSASATTGLPNFSKSTTSAMDYSGTSTAGVAVWGNCNGPGVTNPNFWVKTF